MTKKDAKKLIAWIDMKEAISYHASGQVYEVLEDLRKEIKKLCE